MVVSNRPLHISGLEKGILITESNFKPDRLPTFDEIKTLAKSSVFQRSKPGIWDKIDPVEKDFYRRWFERFGAADPFDFEKMFIFHSANHANFLDAKFFVPVENGVAPYSIADSLRTCSSCLEFFNVLGDRWPLKYVMPCLGAVQFARLPQDQYLKVVSLHRAEKVPPKD